MSEDRNIWVDAVAKLIQLTRDGTLKWDATKPGNLLNQQPDDTIDLIFRTTFKDKRLRLYRRTYSDIRPIRKPASSLFDWTRILQEGVESYRATEVVMDLVTEDGFVLWTFPKALPLSDLYSAVQYQVAGVKDFLNDILN